jgi:hypothetical protein
VDHSHAASCRRDKNKGRGAVAGACARAAEAQASNRLLQLARWEKRWWSAVVGLVRQEAAGQERRRQADQGADGQRGQGVVARSNGG